MSTLRPTAAELAAAVGQTVPDLIAPGLHVLFCGINPSVYTAVVGYHFARPGNRFWPALYGAGFTDRRLRPEEEQELLTLGCGITSIADRATVAAADLAPGELEAGGRLLVEKVRTYKVEWLTFLGITAYRTAFSRPKAVLGPQPDEIGGARVWVLPNPSGLNAHYKPADLARLFAEVRVAAGLPNRRTTSP